MTQSGSNFAQFVRKLCFITACCFSSITLAQSNKPNTEQINLQNYLVQQRNAADLKAKTIQVGEISWAYNEGGSRQKPTILLIHGLAGNRDNWNRVAHFLTPYYHVVIPDLPNNGETKTPQILMILYPM